LIAVLVAVAVLALAAALALGWRPGSSRVTRPLREDEASVLAGRRFADAVDAMRFEEAEAHARHWFLLANDPDPPSARRWPDRPSTD
jgi:type II secretory pathway pseudopilin PulG